MITEPIAYHDEDTPLTGQFAFDDTRSDRRPGILVVHGGAGLDDHARQRARRIAELGYVTLACDMYGEGVAGDRQRVMTCARGLRDDPERLCRRAQAGIDVLRAHPKVDGRLGALGFCFGGMTVLQLARAGALLDAVVSVHGTLKAPRPTQPSQVKARVLVCHGALDPHVPMTDVTAFMEEMSGAAADWHFIVYGGAMHGFTHEDAATNKIPGVAYNAQADARSWTATKLFFAEVFGFEPTHNQ